MAFTEQDLKNQQQEIARLADELKRLNSVFEAQKKELGIEGEVTLDDIEITPALEQALAEAKAEAETLRDAIKQEMLNRDVEELSAGQYIVRWTSVLSQRFDTTAFKKVMPEVYKAYTKQVSSRRFTITA